MIDDFFGIEGYFITDTLQVRELDSGAQSIYPLAKEIKHSSRHVLHLKILLIK